MSVCKRCGKSMAVLVNGLCSKCEQLRMYEINQEKEEKALGVDLESLTEDNLNSEMTDDNYNQWMTMGKTFSPQDMKNSTQLKRMWIVVKLKTSGINDNKLISKYVPYVENILDRSFDKFVNQPCKIIIKATQESEQLIQQSKVIEHENELYIISS